MSLVKLATGLTGLKVAKNPIHILTVLYGKILRGLDKIPADAVYRKHTEEIINKRLTVVKNAKTPAEVSEQINCGQVEELIVQAENELRLVRTFANKKPWEPLQALPPSNQWAWPPAKLSKID